MQLAYRSRSRRARLCTVVALPRADKPGRENAIMQITLTISDEIVREAGVRGMAVIDFVESLVDKGMSISKEKPVLNSAIERIRALRSTAVESKR